MSLPELTYDEFCRKPLVYTLGLRTTNGAQRMYRNGELGFQKETYTPYDERTQEWGEGEVAFFLDGDNTEYANVAMLYEAYMRKVCGIKDDAPCK